MPVDMPRSMPPTQGATREQLTVYAVIAAAICVFWALAIYGLMRLVSG